MNSERFIPGDERASLLFVRICNRINNGIYKRPDDRRWMMFLCLVLLCLVVLFTGCERRALTYYEVTELHILVDWSQSGLAAEEENYGSTILFYPRDGGTPHIFQMGERTGETVRLPMGTYDAIIFNRSFNDFSNIAFRGDSYETLEAYARKVETRVDEVTRVETRTIISSPDELAVATLEGFIVTEDMLGNYSQTTYGRTAASRTVEEETDEIYTLRFVPKKLTRKVAAVLHIEGLNNIRSATCCLSGVAESIFLATGRTSANTVTQEFEPSNPEFYPGSPFNGTLSCHFEVFGLNYVDNNNLYLEALLVDGKTEFTGDCTNVKITENEDGTGVITLTLKADATEKVPDVKPEGGSDSGFDVDVDGWGDDIHTDIPIN